MSVKLIDHMGTDLSVVNAARVSFAKENKEFQVVDDSRLIRYLAKHNHWSPFGHASLQFHVTAPVFVARQLVKHQVGLVWNEVSRRYVDSEPEFHFVEEWRGSPDNKKQGSSDEVIDISTHIQEDYINMCTYTYRYLLDKGVCPEQARMVLPQSMMTEWYWSGTLMAFARVCNLRCKEDAQKETQDIAHSIDSLCRTQFSVSWNALRNMPT